MSALPTLQRTVREAVLRAGERWPGAELSGLALAADGSLGLRRLPAIAPAAVSAPVAVGSSGVAVDASCDLYVADTAGNRVLCISLDRPEVAILPGQEAPPPS